MGDGGNLEGKKASKKAGCDVGETGGGGDERVRRRESKGFIWVEQVTRVGLGFKKKRRGLSFGEGEGESIGSDPAGNKRKGR